MALWIFIRPARSSLSVYVSPLGIYIIETTPQPESVKATNDEIDAANSLTLPPIHKPVVTHNIALVVLTVIALIFALEWAQVFVISLLVGIIFAYTLNPVVAWLEYIRIPRVISASIVMLAVVAILLMCTYALRGQMQNMVNQLPEAASKLSATVNHWKNGRFGNMQKVQTVANEIEKVTNQVTTPSGANKNARAYVVMAPPQFKLNDLLWTSSIGGLTFFGQASMVVFLTYFLLLSGDTFKRKLVRLAGPTLSRKKTMLHILDDINNSIQNYMFMLLITNILLGVLTWGAFTWLGLENAGVWAVVASVLHIVPYLGPAITAGAAGLAALIQFDSISLTLQVMGASLLIATIVGTLVTTWMTGRFAKMNTAAVFISLMFWTWLWGIWGMLLSIPIIVIIRAVSLHIEQLHPVAELLGD